VPTAIILVAVALVSLYAYQGVTENLVIERDRDLTRLSASLLSTELASYTDPLADQSLAVFDRVVVFNANGTILAAEPEQGAGWEADWFRRIPFLREIGSSQPIFSDVVTYRVEDQKVIVVVMPIVDSRGELQGGMAGLFRLGPTTDNALYRGVEKLRRGESSCIYLVDGQGHVIYHSDSSYIGADFSSLEVVQRVLDGQVWAYRTHDLEGREIVASFSPVPDTSWGLVTEESWLALISPSQRYAQLLLVLIFLGVAVPALIVNGGVKRITRPIAELIDAAQEVAGGDFDQKILVSTGDELEDLAEQFNLMATQLQGSYAHLEQKVADRTRELATLNTIAAVVSRSLDLEEILCDALQETLTAMGLTHGEAFRLAEDGQMLMLMAHCGLSDEIVARTVQQPLAAGASGLAAIRGQPVARAVTDYPEGTLKNLLWKEGLQLVISVPLMAKGKTVGAIDLGAPDLRPVTEEELSLLAAIGQQVGVAVENARLYEQAQQLAIMKERNRLARDLHDSVTQSLYGATLYAEAAARQLMSGEVEKAAAHLREIRETAQEALREMRLLIFELRPPILQADGLVAALQTRLEAVEGRVGLETELDVEGEISLRPEVEEGLYRVAVEALNNTLRHARAGRVRLWLAQQDGSVRLEIADDGVGFDLAQVRERGGFGLQGMEERVVRLGGFFSVESFSGKGTSIKVEICQ